MAEAMPGPMQAPPQPTIEEFTAVEQIREEISPVELHETLLSVAAEADPMAVAEFKSELRDLELPPEVLDVLNAMVDEILASPERYAEIRAHYKTQNMPDDLLPEVFDVEFFGAFNMALDELRLTSEMPSRAPQGFANGGVASLRPIPAAMLARHGRNGDTQLAHVTPEEMRLLKSRGGSGTINPVTGLPEFWNPLKSIGKAFKSIGKAIKKFASSTIGKIVIAVALFVFAGPAAAAALGVTAPAGVAAISGFIAGTGSSLAAGNNLKDSLKAGAIGGLAGAAFTGITQGASAFQSTAPAAGSSAAAAPVSGSGASGSAVSGPAAVNASTLATPAGGTVNLGATNLGMAPAQQGFTAGSGLPGTVSLAPAVQPGFTAGPLTSAPIASAPIANVANASGIGGLGLQPTTGYEAYTSAAPQSLAATSAAPQSLAGTSAGFNLGDVSAGSAPIDVTGTQGWGASSGAGSAAESTQGWLGQAADKIMPSRIQAASEATKMQSIADRFYGGSLEGLNRAIANDTASAAVNDLVIQASTSSLMNYAPMAAIGAGVMGLMGGDQDADVPEGWENMAAGLSGGRELLNKYPDRYGLKFGGVNTISTTNPYSAPNPYTTYTAATGSGPDGVATQNFPRKNGPINGPGNGTSDDVPAMLSDGEFVFTAKAVRNMGKGSRRKGAKKMYALMKKLEGAA
jgi:hypothetical protein